MVLSQYQQNLLENQNKKIQRIFSLVPLLMENCKNVIMGPYGDFNITPKYQNINKHHKDILCTRVYNNIFKVLYEIDSPQVSDDIDFGVYDLHLDHTKFLGPQIKTSELKKVNQDLIKILRDEKNNPEINVRKIKVKEQKDKIVEMFQNSLHSAKPSTLFQWLFSNYIFEPSILLLNSFSLFEGKRSEEIRRCLALKYQLEEPPLELQYNLIKTLKEQLLLKIPKQKIYETLKQKILEGNV